MLTLSLLFLCHKGERERGDEERGEKQKWYELIFFFSRRKKKNVERIESAQVLVCSQLGYRVS